MKNVLVLKGGGVKGYIQASCLNELEKAGTDFVNMDLKVGTSVGAINSACIASGMTAGALFNNYPAMVGKIFSKPWWPHTPLYDRKNFVSVWNGLIKLNQMKEVPYKLMITSVDSCTDHPHFFKSWEKEDGEEKLLDVVMRSFAAPFYFGHIVDYINKCVWVDGGCGIDNLPLEYALTEVLLNGWIQEDVTIHCFGTGYSDEDTPFEEEAKQGFIKQILGFIKPADGGMARATSSDEQVNRVGKVCSVLSNIKLKYYDVEIPKEMDGMDLVKFMPQYKDFGIKMAQNGPKAQF